MDGRQDLAVESCDEVYGGGDQISFHPWISLISMDDWDPSVVRNTCAGSVTLGRVALRCSPESSRNGTSPAPVILLQYCKKTV